MNSILEMDPTLNAHICKVTSLPSFTIEEVNIKSLDDGIKKKFTSLATTATSFKWNFGDSYALETTENPIYHTYISKGTYTVGHQTCAYVGCCSEWCYKSIDIQLPGKDKFWAMMGLAGFVFLASEDKCKKGYEPIITKDKKRKCVKKEEVEKYEKKIKEDIER